MYEAKGWLVSAVVLTDAYRWDKVYRYLLETGGLSPREVDAMTLPEILAMCKEDKELGDIGTREHFRMWHQLSAKEKLETAYIERG